MAGMKVLFVASVVKKHINQFHIPYLKWFQDHGFEVHVCASNDFEPGEVCEIPYCDKYYEVPFCRSPFKLQNFQAYRTLKKIIETEQYDLIHCNTPVAAAITRVAGRKVRKRGTKIIYTAHGFHFFQGAPRSAKLYYIIEKLLAPMTDAIVTINQEDYAAARSFCKHCRCDSYLLHGTGVDTVKIQKTKVDVAALRKKIGIPTDAFVVMTTVEINRNKNLDTALRAFAKVCTEDMYYLICGSGDMKTACQQLTKDLQIEQHVIFAGYRYDVFELLYAADLFLFPSHREGLGIAALEAMSAGLPLVASNIRGVTEYAVDQKNSLLFAPDDVDGFASAIQRLHEDEPLRKQLGDAAYHSVEKFDVRNSVFVMEQIYRTYLDIPGSPMADPSGAKRDTYAVKG